MAKKKESAAKSPRKPTDGLRRVTVHSVLGKGTDGAFRVYGVAKKAVSKETAFGVAEGVKGIFEVQHNGKTVNGGRQAFLGADVQAAIVAKLSDAAKAGVQFGVEVTRTGQEVSTEFFVDPAPADVLASLREAAQSE